MTMNYFDIGAIVVILICVILGFKKGLVAELSGIISLVGGVIVAKFLQLRVTEILYDKFDIHGLLERNIQSVVENADYSTLDSLRDSLYSGISSLKVVGSFVNETLFQNNFSLTNAFQQMEKLGMPQDELQSNIVETLMKSLEPLTQDVFRILVFVCLFLISSILLTFIMMLFSKAISNIPVVSETNAGLGAIVGLIKGVFLVIVAFAMLFLAFSVGNSNYLSMLMDSTFFSILMDVKNVLPSTLDIEPVKILSDFLNQG